MAPNHHAKGGAPRGSTSSMKDILYGGSPEPAYGRGNQHSHAGEWFTDFRVEIRLSFFFLLSIICSPASQT
eukprot:2683185-Pyramimonas_sp.AAC.1